MRVVGRGSDRPDEPAQMSPDLGALGPLGRPQHGRDEAALAVEHDHGLEAVFVIMGIEQPQLLAAVNGIEGVVDVEHELLRHLSERGAVRSIIVRPMRSSERASGTFSRRESVGCEAKPARPIERVDREGPPAL